MYCEIPRPGNYLPAKNLWTFQEIEFGKLFFIVNSIPNYHDFPEKPVTWHRTKSAITIFICLKLVSARKKDAFAK